MSHKFHAARLLAVVPALMMLAVACGSSGTELRDPPAGYAAPPIAPEATNESAPAVGFSLSSSAFAPGAQLPERFTCSGEGVSPPLAWAAVPAGTAEFAVVATDPAADFFVHWIVAAIPPDRTTLDEGSIPLDAIEGPNSEGGFGWVPPCPRDGVTHTYNFTVYALTQEVELDPSLTALEVVALLDAAPSQRTVLTATAEPTDG